MKARLTRRQWSGGHLLRFRDEVPYVVALIELPEGPRLLTNIIGPSAKIGDGVHTFERRGDGAVPQFELSEGRSS